MKTIPLTQGKVAMVDDDLYPYLMMNKWHAHKERGRFYAWTKVKGRVIRMHQVVLQAPPGFVPDHKDGDGLNNQRYNLRLGTRKQNNANAKPRRDNTSGFKGVIKSPGGCINPWAAQIQKSYLGNFPTKEQAARAYDEAAIRLFGPFARTNKMLGLLP